MAASTITRATITNDTGTASSPNLDGDVLNSSFFNTKFYDKIDEMFAGAGSYATFTLGGKLSVEGGQIVFPATQSASTNANTLDDYEEGTFTPTITSAGGGTPTYTTQVGRYVKIGRLVHFMIHITLATKGTLAAGAASIASLPFTSENVTNQNNAVAFGSYSLTTAVVWLQGYVTPNSTSITLLHNTAAATSGTSTTVADLSATSMFIVSGYYSATA